MGVCTKLRIIFYTFVRRSLDLMRDDMILLSHLLRIINLTYILYNSAIISSYEYLALKILLLSCTSTSRIIYFWHTSPHSRRSLSSIIFTKNFLSNLSIMHIIQIILHINIFLTIYNCL